LRRADWMHAEPSRQRKDNGRQGSTVAKTPTRPSVIPSRVASWRARSSFWTRSPKYCYGRPSRAAICRAWSLSRAAWVRTNRFTSRR
jgi:hypothetical protein